MDGLSRRSFLKGGAIGTLGLATAGIMAACAPTTADSGAQGSESADAGAVVENQGGTRYTKYANLDGIGSVVEADYEEEADFVVVGTGITGLPCAMIAAEQMPEARIVLLEKMATLGGNTNFAEINAPSPGMDLASARSAAQTAVINSSFFKDQDLFTRFYMDKGVNYGWLYNKHKVELEHRGISTYYKGGHGNSCIATLKEHLDSDAVYSNVDLRTSTRATALLMEDEYTCSGVQVLDSDNKVGHIKAKAVMLATGGMGTNLELLSYYTGQDVIEKCFPYGFGQDGDGQLMVEQTAHGMAKSSTVMTMWNNVRGFDDDSQLGAAVTMQSSCLFVNQNGERFENEDIQGSFNPPGTDFIASGKSIENQGRTISILGSNLKKHFETVGCNRLFFKYYGETVSLDEDLSRYADNENVYKADTLEELAEAVGIPVDAFVATVAQYEADCAAGTGDSVFGKSAEYMVSLGEGPYYAFEVSVGLMASLGGIRIDRNAQVCDAYHKPIAGLFAGGICTSGWNNDTYSLGTAQHVGLWCGSQVARYVVENVLGGTVAEDWFGAQEYQVDEMGEYDVSVN